MITTMLLRKMEKTPSNSNRVEKKYLTSSRPLTATHSSRSLTIAPNPKLTDRNSELKRRSYNTY